MRGLLGADEDIEKKGESCFLPRFETGEYMVTKLISIRSTGLSHVKSDGGMGAMRPRVDCSCGYLGSKVTWGGKVMRRPK